MLVSAAAGSGKTAVLTERIKRLVTEDGKGRAQLKELLVVTFTEAAASEMKSRIAAALTEAAEDDPHAEAQLRQLGSAKIMTFHSFCLTVLRRYFYVIELDPSFSVADDKRAAALREEALDEVFAEAFADEEFRSSFTDFLLCYSEARDERKAREKVLEVYDFIMTLPEPFVWLEKSMESLSVPAEKITDNPAIIFANAETGYRLSLARALTEQVGDLLIAFGFPGLAAKNAIDLETVSHIERLFMSGDMEGTRAALQGLKFETFRAAAGEKEAFEEFKDFVKLRRDRVKNILRDEDSVVFFAQPYTDHTEEIAHIAPHARTLGKLVKRFSDIYTRIKRSENVIDFTDFEHMALKILEDESIADDYRRRFSYIFIDEYQDSNYLKEVLVSRIARRDNVFMVGDIKQSIYGFLNAAPAIFLEKYKKYPAGENDGNADLRVDLSQNYRSKTCVIDAVNAVFENVIEDHYSGMDYDESARLVKGISYEPEWEGKTCLHLVRRDREKERFDSDTESEAALCARIILDTVGQEYYDSKQKVVKKIKFGDIVILLKKAKDAADVYRKTLEANGIPAMTDRGEGYFETVEIDTFLGLLRAIVNLRRDVPLAAAMCSTVFGFELSELAVIRADNREGFFYTAFLSYAEKGPDEALREKCAVAADRLARWRDEERFMRLDDFLWKLMRESGFYEYASGLSNGARRKANLRALLDRAAGFQSGRVEGLRGFIAFLDKIKMRGGIEQANLIMDGEDVCRIMSVHGSKGREFPVVLLAGLGKSLSQGRNRDDSLLLHRDVGLSLRWVDPAAHTYKKTLLHSALKLRQEIDERAEAIRLLYVGMTRAQDTLHLIGTTLDPERLLELYDTEGMSPKVDTDVFGAKNYLQLILPTAVKHRELFNINTVIASEAKQSINEENLCRTEGDKTDGDVPCVLKVFKTQGTSPSVLSPSVSSPYIYPYTDSAKLKSKYSVTELSKAPGDEQPVFFMAGGAAESDEDAGLTAAERGTALHKALELLDFSEAYKHRGDRSWFESFKESLVANGVLSGAEAEAADADILQRFANSDLLARAAASDFLMKEAPFNMKVPYWDAEEIVVQGVIDCLFTEGEGLVIADYKTGWFDVSDYDSEAERIRTVYGEQLKLYRRAVELIFEKPVIECIVYMARVGVTVEII